MLLQWAAKCRHCRGMYIRVHGHMSVLHQLGVTRAYSAMHFGEAFGVATVPRDLGATACIQPGSSGCAWGIDSCTLHCRHERKDVLRADRCRTESYAKI